MIKLDRRQLIDLARLVVVANTAPSLFQGLLDTDSVSRLRFECSPNELLDFYDRLTARARRTEITLGLSYGTLTALLLNKEPLTEVNQPDVSRLKWGEQFRQLAEGLGARTQVIEVPTTWNQPRIVASNQPSSGLILLTNEPHREERK